MWVWLAGTLLLAPVAALLVRHPRARWALLTVGSLVVLGCRDLAHVAWVGGTAATATALATVAVQQPSARPAVARLAALLVVLPLAWFRYGDALPNPAARPSTWGLTAPGGLSFVLFSALIVVLDTCRDRFRPAHPLEVFGHVAFAPTALSGPLVRPRELADPHRAPRVPTVDDLVHATSFLLQGLVLKFALADTVGAYVDLVDRLARPEPVLVWAAAAAHGLVIYADLAAWTALARGVALTLGVALPPNFDHPMSATSTPDFWRRWHMSLSSFFRDYLLVPLLGEQPSRIRTAASVLLTFAIIGLWHGPSVGALAFGLWHGAWCLRWVAAGWRSQGGPSTGVAAPVHTAIVLIPGLVLARAPDLTTAWQDLVAGPWHGSDASRTVAVALWTLTLAGTAAMALASAIAARVRFGELHRRWPALVTTSWALAIVVLWMFPPTTDRDFVYFRF